jgi:RNA polymerase sigma-70 factor (ECF subfamily)
MDRDAQFEQHRSALFSLAYRMMGTRADAEDIVQDAYLRWKSAVEEQVRSPKSYLTTVVARLSLDALKAAYRKRETYVGEWLAEPIVQPLGAKQIVMAESLSIAFLRLMESLTPAERVAFLLRDIFEADYEQIASALETTETNSRQLVARARKHLQGSRPRFAVDRERQVALLEKFLTACATGELSQLTAMLTEDALLVTDGGGKVPSALNPIHGADRVARFLRGVAEKGAKGLTMQWAMVNGDVGVVLMDGDRPSTVLSLTVEEDGMISGVFLVNNPDKLPRLGLD